MAGTAEEFIVRLNNQVSGPAAASIGALGQLEAKIKATQAAASSGGTAGAAIAKMGAGASGATSAFGMLGRAGEAMAGGLASGVKGAAAAIGLLGSTASKVINGDIRGALNGLGAAAQGAMGKLTGALASLGPYGAAIASVLTVATGGVSTLASALLDGMAAAIGMAEGGAKIKATFNALAGGEKAGAATLKMVSDLSAKLPFATGQIREWAQGLLAAGLKGDKLKSAVEAVAAAQAIMGDEGAAAAQKMIKGLAEGGAGAQKMVADLQKGGKKGNAALAEMGLTTAKLAAAMGMTPEKFAKAKISAEQMNAAIQKALKKQGKDPLSDMMNSWPVIMMKAKAGFMSLFSGLGPAVKPFMAAVKSLFSQFNKGSPIIKSLQKVFTEVFGTLFKYAGQAVRAISAFIKENVNAKSIGKVWATIKGFISEVGKSLAPVIAHFKSASKSGMLMKGVGVAFKAIAIAIKIVVAVGGALLDFFITSAEQAGTAMAAFEAIAGSLTNIPSAISDMASSAVAALTGWASGAVDAASNFISGLLSGIQSGAGAIIAAVAGLASSAMGAFKSALGIASPSKVMMGMGGNFSAGAAAGIEGGAPKVEASAHKMGGKAAGGAARGMGGGKGGKGKGGGEDRVTFTNCTFGSVGEATFKGWVLEVLDGDARGGPEPDPVVT